VKRSIAEKVWRIDVGSAIDESLFVIPTYYQFDEGREELTKVGRT